MGLKHGHSRWRRRDKSNKWGKQQDDVQNYREDDTRRGKFIHENFLLSTVDSRQKNSMAWSHTAHGPSLHGVQSSALPVSPSTHAGRHSLGRPFRLQLGGIMFDRGRQSEVEKDSCVSEDTNPTNCHTDKPTTLPPQTQ